MRWIKFLAVLLLAAFLLNVGPGTIRADGPVTGGSQDQSSLMRNGVDPNYVPTAAELKAIAAKQAQANEYFARKHASNQIQPMTAGYHYVQIGNYKEPNDYAHRNYCGPAATQVILSARTSQVPGIEQIATDEHLDPNWGVYNTDVRYELNRLLNTSWYWYVTGVSQATLKSDTEFDVDHGWALDASLHTNNMPGWSVPAKHIVAIYGYWDEYNSIYYAETSSPTAGYNGPYLQGVSFAAFSGFMNYNNGDNNSMVW